MKRYDEKILWLLLDKYENSLLYSGRNQINIKITVPVSKHVLPEYFDVTSTQYDVIHEQLETLEAKGLIRLIWKNKRKGHILEKCELVVERVDIAYALLRRKPRSGKEQCIQDICLRFKGRDRVLDHFLDWILERIEAGESIRKYVNPDAPAEFEKLCQLVWRILTNDKECFLREFSVKFFNDSKVAEKDVEKAVGIIVRFHDNSDDFKTLDTTEVLEEYNIYRNPSWLMMKGTGLFSVIGREPNRMVVDLQAVPGGVGIANQDIEQICWSHEKKPDMVLTIENLTTFHRWDAKVFEAEQSGNNILCIYLGGYHNKAKRQYLKKLYASYPEAEYCHFGDIDCGGFRIWKDLCIKTEIPFKTFLMDCSIYTSYLEYGRSLTEQDRKTLHQMQEDAFFSEYRELFALMLEKGKKLEQECIDFDTATWQKR